MANADSGKSIASLLLSRSSLFSGKKKPVLTSSIVEEIVMVPVLTKTVEPIGNMNAYHLNKSNTKATETLSLLIKQLATILGSDVQKTQKTDKANEEISSMKLS